MFLPSPRFFLVLEYSYNIFPTQIRAAAFLRHDSFNKYENDGELGSGPARDRWAPELAKNLAPLQTDILLNFFPA